MVSKNGKRFGQGVDVIAKISPVVFVLAGVSVVAAAVSGSEVGYDDSLDTSESWDAMADSMSVLPDEDVLRIITEYDTGQLEDYLLDEVINLEDLQAERPLTPQELASLQEYQRLLELGEEAENALQ